MDASKFCVLPKTGGQAWLTQDSAINWGMLIQAVIKESKDVSHFIPFSQVAAYRTYNDQYCLHIQKYMNIYNGTEYASVVQKFVNNGYSKEEAYIKATRKYAAYPGTSNHGYGLAFDFTFSNESDPAYQWMKVNSERFGFYAYANEYWHLNVYQP